MRRIGKNPKSQLQNEADTIQSKYFIKKIGKCELCGSTNRLNAHHIVERSRSNALRYREENIIVLCSSDHTRVHNQICGRPGNNAIRSHDLLNVIFEKRGGKGKGEKWKNWLESEGRKLVNTDLNFYQEAFDRYSKLLNEL
jgi:5-methylcytosine-specific restriction endonuclease McrA